MPVLSKRHNDRRLTCRCELHDLHTLTHTRAAHTHTYMLIDIIL